MGVAVLLAIEEARFWAKVAYRAGCMEWTAYRCPLGYGHFSLRRGARQVHYKAHRLSYELLVGPIPDGAQLDHLCRNTSCVNPLHLEPVSARENNARGLSPTALHGAATHCSNGHPFSAANTYITPGYGFRQCRTCRDNRRPAEFARRRERRAQRHSIGAK